MILQSNFTNSTLPHKFSFSNFFLDNQTIFIFFPLSILDSILYLPSFNALRAFYPKSKFIIFQHISHKPLHFIFRQFYEPLYYNSDAPNHLKFDFNLYTDLKSPTLFFNFDHTNSLISNFFAQNIFSDFKISIFADAANPTYNVSYQFDPSNYSHPAALLQYRLNAMYYNRLTFKTVHTHPSRTVLLEATQFLLENGYQTQQPLIFINLTQPITSYKPAFSTMIEYFKRFSEETNAFFVIICNQSKITSSFTHQIKNTIALSQLPIYAQIAIAALSDLFFTTIDLMLALGTLFDFKHLVIIDDNQKNDLLQLLSFKEMDIHKWQEIEPLDPQTFLNRVKN